MAESAPPLSEPTFPHLEECLAMMEEAREPHWETVQEATEGPEISFHDFETLREMASHFNGPQEHAGENQEEHLDSEMQPHGLMHGLSPFTEDEHSERAQEHGSPAESEWTEEAISKRGISLSVGGIILLLLALILATRLPAPWMEWHREPDAWTKKLALAQTWITAWGVLALVAAGMGSINRRRWSVPLIHAGGWLAAIGVLMSLAVASGGFFFLVPHETPADKAALVGIGSGLAKVGIYGVLVPLVLITLYQRRHLVLVCDRSDRRGRWTDGLPEPLLMLWLCAVSSAVGLSGLFFFDGFFPLLGTMIDGQAAKLSLLASVICLVVSGWLVARNQKSGWTLLLLVSLFLAASTIWTFLKTPWHQVLEALGKPVDAMASSEPSRLAALLAGAIFAPLAMVLLMSRNSFPKPDEHAGCAE